MAGGEYNVICDRCGGKFKASECRTEWTGLFVCTRGCWERRHPQLDLPAAHDDQSVPIARPDIAQSIGTVTLSADAAKWATTIDVSSITNISDKDNIGIELDYSDVIHWTFVNGTPSGSTVTLNNPMIGAASSGNTVHLPALNNETWTS